MFGKFVLVAWQIIFFHSALVISLEVNFSGSGYVTYTLQSTQKTIDDNIFLLFRTIKPSGLLLHAAGREGDFLTLELLRGKIRYTHSLGEGGYHEVLIGDNLADNDWHQTEVHRNGMNLKVLVDKKKNISHISGKYSDLDIDGNIYVAGINKSGEMAFRKDRHFKFEKFEGCLDDVNFNDINILQLAYEKNSSTNVHGNVAYNCTKEASYNPATFPNPQAYLKLTAPERNSTDYKFKFRTYEADGLLLVQSLESRNGADISIALESGRIRLDVTFNDPNVPVTQHAGNKLEDGLWHSVSVSIDSRRVLLTVDDWAKSDDLPHRFVNSFSSPPEIIVGAGRRRKEKERIGFVGCMDDLVIQGRRVNFSKTVRTQVLLKKCHLIDYCLPSPCKNRGRCIQKLNKTRCDCQATDFTGKRCEESAFEIANCDEWRAAGKTKDDFYKINPGSMKPFVVSCNMSNTEGPATVVLHDQVGENITASSGEKIGGFYKHSVGYDNEKTNIEAIINSSTHCRQFIRYHCYNSVLFDSPRKFNLGRGARWKSRDRKIQDYWGGARPGSRSCACGRNRSCSQPSRLCNCDIADKNWRSDEGYLTDKGDLPVTSVIFSVDGTSAESYYNLGNLECFGSTNVKLSTTPGAITISAPSQGGTAGYQSSKGSNAPDLPTSTTPKKTSGRLLPAASPSSAISTNDRGQVTQEFPSSAITITTSSKSTSSTTPPDDETGPIVIIETPRKYITIRETGHQQLVTIVLSTVLVVFICAIIVLLVRQNLLWPFKCLQMPVYEDATNIELGPSTPLYDQTEPEVLQYEASPYPYGDVIVLRSGGSLARSTPDMDSEAETDRLDISNRSSYETSEMSDAFHEQDGTFGKQEAHDFVSPRPLDLGTAGLTKAIIDVFSLSLSKEPDVNKEVTSKRETCIRKPVNKEGDHPENKYASVSSRHKAQTNRQRRRMSISEDESIVDTSASDQNNSSDSRLSMNTRSWSDETVSDSENDEDIYRSDRAQRHLAPKGDRINETAYEGSNLYLSLEREDQFVEISQHLADRKSGNHSSDKIGDFVKGETPVKNNTTKCKWERQDSDKQQEPKKSVGTKVKNGRSMKNGRRHNGRAYHLNHSDKHENSLGSRCDENGILPANEGSSTHRSNGLKDHVVFIPLRGQSRAQRGEGEPHSDKALRINRYETEI